MRVIPMFFFGICLALGSAALCGATMASEDGSPKTKTSVDSLIEEFSQKHSAWVTKMMAATPETKPSIVASRPRPEDWADKFWKIANNNPGTPDARKALVWVLERMRDADSHKEAVDALATHHLEDGGLDFNACSILSRVSFDTVGEFLEALVMESPHESVRAQAAYACGKWLMKNREQDLEAIEEMLGTVIADYADAPHPYKKTLGQAAERDLFEARHLTVGKVAPDIEGEDEDGVSFKLSDYRGKVVFLDYWAYW